MTQRIYSVAKSEEKDSVEPTSSAASSTPDDVGRSALEPDEAELGPTAEDDYTSAEDDYTSEVGEEPELLERAERVEPDGYQLDAEAGEEPVDSDDVAAGVLAGREGDESNGELVAVGAPTDRSVAKARGTGRVEKKGRATPKRRPSARPGGRTTPVTFVKESVAELRKVVYPTGQQLANYFVVVLIFVLFIIAIVSLLDLAFGWAILKVFS
jgi:preprotein translocase subunit SecE